MHDLYSLKEKIVKELEEYGQKELSSNSLEKIDKLAHAAKNIAKVIEFCEEDEYSNAMSRRSYRSGRSYRGGSYANDMSYDGGGSYDGSQSFVRPDGSYRGSYESRSSRYSRAGDDMVMQLREMMQKAPDERTKSELRNLIEKMERM